MGEKHMYCKDCKFYNVKKCYVKPKKENRDANDIACKEFEDKD